MQALIRSGHAARLGGQVTVGACDTQPIVLGVVASRLTTSDIPSGCPQTVRPPPVCRAHFFFDLIIVTWRSLIDSISSLRPPIAVQFGLQMNRPVKVAVILLSVVPLFPWDKALSSSLISACLSTSSDVQGPIPPLHFSSFSTLPSPPSLRNSAWKRTNLPMNISACLTTSQTVVSIGLSGDFCPGNPKEDSNTSRIDVAQVNTEFNLNRSIRMPHHFRTNNR